MQINKLFWLLFSIVVVTYWKLWEPGLRVAFDFHYYYPELTRQFVGFPNIWRELATDGMGLFVAPTLSIWPILFTYGLMSLVNIPFTVMTYLLLIVFLSVGTYFIRKLLASYNVDTTGQIIGSLVFLVNSYIILLIDGGQLYLAFGYVVLPGAFWAYIQVIEQKKIFYSVLFLFLTLAMSVIDFRSLYIFAILIALSVFFEIVTCRGKGLLNFLGQNSLLAILAGFLILGFHMFWILPLLWSRMDYLPLGYSSISQLNYLSFSTLSHSIYLYQPHWYKNVFGVITGVDFMFIFFPIMVFMAPILIRKSKLVAFWLMIALISTFFSKGTQLPFPQIYDFAFQFVPGFALFRDPTKFYYLIALSYSILIGLTFNRLNELVKPKKLMIGLSMLIILYLIFLVRPVYLGQMTGLFTKPYLQDEYFSQARMFETDRDFGRILWLPDLAPIGYQDNNHPAVLGYLLSQKRPFLVATVGTYQTLNFLTASNFTGELLDVAGIKYVTLPPLDPRRVINVDQYSPDQFKAYNSFWNQLKAQPYVESVVAEKTSTLKLRNSQQRVFIPNNSWWVVGSDDLYLESTHSARVGLSKNALVFSEESLGMGSWLDKFKGISIFLNNKGLTDLAGTFLDRTQVYFPSVQLMNEPNSAGWWKRSATDFIPFREFLHEKYSLDSQDFSLGGGWAIAEGDKELTITGRSLRSEGILLARVMESTQSGQISFWQGGKEIGIVNTKRVNSPNVTKKISGDMPTEDEVFEYSRADFRWFKVGYLSDDMPITLRTEGNLNVVNAVAVVSESEWQQIQQKVDNLRGNIKSYSDLKAHASLSAQINFEQINPSQYKVVVDGLTRGQMVVLSNNYSPHWVLNDQRSVPVYSFLNGFWVEKDGVYILNYSPQRWVIPGMIVSGFTVLVFVIGIFVVLRVKRIKMKKL